MRIHFTASAAAVVLAVAGAPAWAQDASTAEPVEDGWTGFYVGGSVGMAAQPNDASASAIRFDTDLDGDFSDQVTTAAGANAFSPGFCGGFAAGPTPSDGCRKDKDGFEYYGHLGYDRQMGNLVLGVVGEFGTSDTVDSVSAFSTTPARYTMTRELKYGAGLRLRAGYTPNGETLFYATGGGAYGKIKNRFYTSNGANSFTGNGSSDAWGYSVGGGVDQKLGDNFSIGLQYLYTDLRDDDYRVMVGPGSAPATNPFLLDNPSGTDMRRADDKFMTHSIRATAAFRF